MSDESRGGSESELDLLAVLDDFARQVQAGAAPQLSAYLERYPRYAAELLALASGDLGDLGDLDDLDNASDAATLRTEREPRAGRVGPDQLSAGSRRALAAIFPAASPPAHPARVSQRRKNATQPSEDASEDASKEDYDVIGGGLRAVAERRKSYTTERQPDAPDAPDAGDDGK